MASVSSLWVGGPLHLIQEISLASFVYHGHTMTLYVYDMNLKVPDGVIKKDAREIVPETEIFYHMGKLSPFADYFRYQMMKKTGSMWVDADTICFTDEFFDDREFVFIHELVEPEYYAQGVLKLPQNSQILDDLVSESSRIKNSFSEDSKWGNLGPGLLTELVKKYNLEQYAVPYPLINLVDAPRFGVQFWDPKYKNEILKKSEAAYCGTFFNSALEFFDFADNKNVIPPDSAIEYFYKKFILKEFGDFSKKRLQFVYPCRYGENEELRYSIRSVLEFFPDAEIWVVGGKPSWYTGNYIHVKKTSVKYNSVKDNIDAILNNPDIDNSFVYMNDDFYLTDKPDFRVKYHRGDLGSRIRAEYQENHNKLYFKLLNRTYTRLKKHMDKPFDYELHIPVMVEKQYLRKVSVRDLWRSFYFNLHHSGGYLNIKHLGGDSFSITKSPGIQIEDCKVYTCPEKNELVNFVERHKPFLSSNDSNFETMKTNFLQERFPNSTSYEIK